MRISVKNQILLNCRIDIVGFDCTISPKTAAVNSAVVVNSAQMYINLKNFLEAY